MSSPSDQNLCLTEDLHAGSDRTTAECPATLPDVNASWCRMDPLWNSVVVAGLQDDKPFLGMISMLGVHFSDEHIATGNSPDQPAVACLPLLRWEALCTAVS